MEYLFLSKVSIREIDDVYVVLSDLRSHIIFSLVKPSGAMVSQEQGWSHRINVSISQDGLAKVICTSGLILIATTPLHTPSAP